MGSDSILFKNVTPETLETVKKYLSYLLDVPRACDFSIGCIFMWRDYYKAKYAEYNGAFIMEFTEEDGTVSYTYPLGENTEEAIRELIVEKGKICFCLLSEEELEVLKRIAPDGDAEYERQWCDYVYAAEDIVGLKGRRFSGQRNHINKFKKMYPNWKFEAVISSELTDIRAFFEDFYALNPPSNEALEAERDAVFEQLDNYELYGQLGGVLYVDGIPVAASLGEIVGKTLIVHTEKAKREIEGSYPMIVNCFAERFCRDGVEYINREEDCGEPGLRTSKLSYHPLFLLKKWNYYI